MCLLKLVILSGSVLESIKNYNASIYNPTNFFGKSGNGRATGRESGWSTADAQMLTGACRSITGSSWWLEFAQEEPEASVHHSTPTISPCLTCSHRNKLSRLSCRLAAKSLPRHTVLSTIMSRTEPCRIRTQTLLDYITVVIMMTGCVQYNDHVSLFHHQQHTFQRF